MRLPRIIDESALLVAKTEELIDSVEFDVNGASGRGGHGGLISIETLKVTGELRQRVHFMKRMLKHAKLGGEVNE